MKKINGDPFFPKLYGIKMCSDAEPPYLLIKMDKFDYTMKKWMKKWMKSDHTVNKWKSLFKKNIYNY